MSKKKIVFYIPHENTQNTPYPSEKTYLRHKDFISYFPEYIEFYIVSDKEQYLGNESFHPGFVWKKDTLMLYKGEKIEADLVLGIVDELNTQRVYHNPIKEMCKNKKIIETLFPQYTFDSYECQNYEEVKENFYKVSSNLKVLKPLLLSQGEGIYIGDTLPEKYKLEGKYPYLIQKFLDTSGGFFGYPGIHDFRVVIVNGAISGAFLRIAAQGSFQANVSLGANIIDIGSNNIPPEIMKIIHKVESYTSKKYPQRYYSIDFGVGKNGEIKIFECNAAPALSTPSIRKHLAEDIMRNILKLDEMF